MWNRHFVCLRMCQPSLIIAYFFVITFMLFRVQQLNYMLLFLAQPCPVSYFTLSSLSLFLYVYIVFQWKTFFLRACYPLYTSIEMSILAIKSYCNVVTRLETLLFHFLSINCINQRFYLTQVYVHEYISDNFIYHYINVYNIQMYVLPISQYHCIMADSILSCSRLRP